MIVETDFTSIHLIEIPDKESAQLFGSLARQYQPVRGETVVFHEFLDIIQQFFRRIGPQRFRRVQSAVANGQVYQIPVQHGVHMIRRRRVEFQQQG